MSTPFSHGDLVRHVNGGPLCRVRGIQPRYEPETYETREQRLPQLRLPDRIEIGMVDASAVAGSHLWVDGAKFEKVVPRTPEQELAERAMWELTCSSFYAVINLSDTFALAVADAEEVRIAEFQHPKMLELVAHNGHDAILAYVAVKRGRDPLATYQTPKYWFSKGAILMLQADGELLDFDD